MAPASAFRKDFPHQGEIFKETDFTVIPRLNSFIWFKRTDRVGLPVELLLILLLYCGVAPKCARGQAKFDRHQFVPVNGMAANACALTAHHVIKRPFY